MVFGNGVKNIQAAAYNGARTLRTISFVSSPTFFIPENNGIINLVKHKTHFWDL